jgi:protein transport protein SEC31
VLQCLNYDINNILSRVDNFFKTKPRRLMQILERGNVDEAEQNENIPNDNKSSHLLRDQIDNDAKTINPAHDPLLTICQKPPIDAETFFNDLGHTDVKLVDKSSPLSEHSQEKVEIEEKVHNEMDELHEKVSGALTTGTKTEKDLKSPISQNSASADCKKKKDGSTASFSEWENGQELLIKQCFVIGQRPLAIELCVEAGRWAEAFLLAATSEDPFLWSATTQLYFSTKENDKFSQIIGCILRSKWQTLVQISDLKKWNETLALIASYAPPGMLYSMSQELGHRLEREAFDIRAAVVCYLLAGSFDDACRVWSNSTHKSRCRKSFEKDLQGLVEKLTILKRATGHQELNSFYNKKAT